MKPDRTREDPRYLSVGLCTPRVFGRSTGNCAIAALESVTRGTSFHTSTDSASCHCMRRAARAPVVLQRRLQHQVDALLVLSTSGASLLSWSTLPENDGRASVSRSAREAVPLSSALIASPTRSRSSDSLVISFSRRSTAPEKLFPS